MIEFMVLSAPRSSSTWVANWLTTDTTLCLHDPVLEHRVEELDRLQSDRRLGLSCTALALVPDWVNNHPARKVIVHRPLSEVNLSLANLHMAPLDPVWQKALDKIEGLHVRHRELFDQASAAAIYEYLLQRPLDEIRYNHLVGMQVEPAFERLRLPAGRAADFIRYMQAERKQAEL